MQKNNVIFKCFYYKPKEKYNSSTQADKIKKREFLSCNSSYNYVSYIDTGAENKLPKDFTEYVGNNEKSCGVFNQDGLLNDKQKRDLREMLRNTQSCIWDFIISFKEDFGNEYCKDYETAYNFLKFELPKFFTRAGLDKDNIIWYAGLHENTDNKHIHISFFEKEPQYFKNGGKLSYHNGTIAKDVLVDSKRIFEQKLTNIAGGIFKARNNLENDFKENIKPSKLTKKIEKMLNVLYACLPNSGRLSYDSENMFYLKSYIDKITKFVLTHNEKTKKDYVNFENELYKLKLWQKERDYKTSEKYKNDLYKRLGNKIIQTAMLVGKLKEKSNTQKIYNSKYGYYQKKRKAKILDNILALMKQSAIEAQEEMENFKRYYNHLEYLRRKNEYENYSHSNYEM